MTARTPRRASARTAGRTLALAMGLACLLGAARPLQAQPAPAGSADPGAAPDSPSFRPTPRSREASTEILRLVGQGSWQEALPLCRNYVREHPGDPRMLYNLACLENRAGREPQAVAALKEALAAGFDEMGFALQDPDLAGVADDPDLWLLDEAAASGLARTAGRKALTLDLGTWSGAVGLDPTADDTALAAPSLRVCWQPAGLDLELTLPGPWADFAAADLSPWQGGPGAVVVLAVPDASGPFTSGNTFMFAFGAQQGKIVGAMYLSGLGRWQQIVEMQPKVSRAGTEGILLAGRIPWQSIMPFHPLVDGQLGLNVVVRRDRGAGYPKAGLLPDPWAFAPQGARHRFVPLDFRLETLGTDLFMGKVSDSLSRQEPLNVGFTAVSAVAGRGSLTVDVVDPGAHSLLPQGPVPEPVDLPAGPLAMARPVDFSGLRTGAYLVKAELVFPSGKNAVWSTTVLHLAAGWEEDLRTRIAGLRAVEQATARQHLQALAAAVASHHTRRNPGPLANTLQGLQAMLARADQSGSILPTQGAADFVYPGPQGQERRCSLYLPAPDLPGGLDGAAVPEPVLVLTTARGREAQIVERIARNYEHGPADSTGTDTPASGRVIYVVPLLDPAAATADQVAAEARACLDWALAYFGAARAAVAGIDAAAEGALVLARAQPVQVSALVVFAGQDLAAGDPAVGEGLSPAPAGLPLTWIDFVQETAVSGRAPALLRALKDLGWTVAQEQQVRGGLSLSQAADRLVLWSRAAVR